MSGIAKTPTPPYYAVIFTNIQSEDTEGYGSTATRMEELAREQPGYLGFESARDGLGIAVSYWRDLESIANWKANAEHALAQQAGRDRWYTHYTTRIARVERDYSFAAEK
ncbi:MAG: antibiotic biosynthesis monooxygenase [Pseudomonadota bacterium]